MTTSRITSAVALVATLVFASCGQSATNTQRTPDTRDTPVPILMYHVIEQAPPGAPYSELYVSESDFAAQMRWLQGNGYRAVTQRDVWAHWHRGRALPPKLWSSRSTTATEALLGRLCRTSAPVPGPES